MINVKKKGAIHKPKCPKNAIMNASIPVFNACLIFFLFTASELLGCVFIAYKPRPVVITRAVSAIILSFQIKLFISLSRKPRSFLYMALISHIL